MLDIKEWLQTTGMKVAEDCFKSPPPLPYIVFTDENNTSGADDKNCILKRSISVEMYSEIINKQSESKIEALLNEKSINFKRNRTWVDSQRFWQTVYDFDLVEKF